MLISKRQNNGLDIQKVENEPHFNELLCKKNTIVSNFLNVLLLLILKTRDLSLNAASLYKIANKIGQGYFIFIANQIIL